MEIVVKCRRSVVTERFREHVAEKLAKLERLDPKVISVEVEVIREPNPRLSAHCHRVELTCRRRGPVVRGEASAEDVHAALDAAFAKLEERLRRAADRRRVHHGSRAPVSVAAALATTLDPDVEARQATEAPETETERSAASGNGEMATDRPEQAEADGDVLGAVREKRHPSVPMTLDQALHEMELVGHDFFLYWDADADAPSVVYHRRGYRYGVLRLDRVVSDSP